MLKAAKNALLSDFCSITGASPKDARRYLDKHQRRLDAAIDAYYQEGGSRTSIASTSKLNALFEKYKDPTGDEISIDGNYSANVVLLAVAYELKSPRVGEWNKKGWVEGWSRLGVIDGMKDTLTRLRCKVYDHTFGFARTEGQRSLAIDTALAFWNLLIPTGLTGGALKHDLTGEDVDMDGEESSGWTDEHTQWWFQFLTEKGGKLFDFIRSIDSQFLTHDAEAAWPSTIDDFVAWASKKRFIASNRPRDLRI
ncbi:Cullin binding-domain-containing protein [Suillus cothurnatus]|nr:Cullin binding-domain-containing protein [Suillus cothurnatus]